MFSFHFAQHLATDSARGGSDWYAGAAYGWTQADIKANMDACCPDDAGLQADITAYMAAIKEGKAMSPKVAKLG